MTQAYFDFHYYPWVLAVLIGSLMPTFLLAVNSEFALISLFITIQIGLVYLWSMRNREHIVSPSSNRYLSPIDGVIRIVDEKSALSEIITNPKVVEIQTNFLDSHTVYAPIDGEIRKYELTRDIAPIHISDLLSPWLAERIKLNFKLPMERIKTEELICELYNHETQKVSVVKTQVRYTFIQLAIFSLFGLSEASHTGFIYQGSPISFLNPVFIGPFAKVSTYLYMENDTTLSAYEGQILIAGETQIGKHFEQPILP